jgi:hypothetical protein
MITAWAMIVSGGFGVAVAFWRVVFGLAGVQVH